MNVEYMRTAQKSYMIVKGVGLPCEKYELNMIMKNDIPCLLAFQMIKAEGKEEYWYDVGSMQALRNIFVTEPVGERQLQLILRNIMDMKSIMEDYLLDDDNICFSADMVYYDRMSERIKFCYVPGWGSACSDKDGELKHPGVRVLFEEVLKYLDHGDPAAVRMGYEMYDRCVKAPFMAADCLDCLNLSGPETLPAGTVPGSIIKKNTYGTPAPSHALGVRDRDLSWMEEREAFSDVFMDDDSDVEFLQNIPESGSGHRKKRRKNRDSQEKKDRDIQEKKNRDRQEKKDRDSQEKKDRDRLENKKRDKIKKEKKNLHRENSPADDKGPDVYGGTPLLLSDDDDVGATELFSETGGGKTWELIYKGDGVENDMIPDSFPFVVGSDPSRANGVLKARTVSRIHARFYMEGDSLFVEDFNSTNGTYVNSRLLPMNTPAELHDGDRLFFATEEYRVFSRLC